VSIGKLGWRWHAAFVTLGFASIWAIYSIARPYDQVTLTIGEPYENVRLQSHSTLPPAVPGMFRGGFVTRPAILRFSDPQYGFVTPAAKFLYVSADQRGIVWSVILSPQVETLPLDETMAVLADLQNQFRLGKWRSILLRSHPPIADTPAMRAKIRSGASPQAFWLASDKYQASLDVHRFVHENRPNDERYLITLQLSGPPLRKDRP
jgi:hypothetical protein